METPPWKSTVSCDLEEDAFVGGVWFTTLSLCSLWPVLHDAVVKPEGSTVVTKGGKLEASCNALSSLQTQTVWMKVRTVDLVQVVYPSMLAILKISQNVHSLISVDCEERVQQVGTCVLPVQSGPGQAVRLPADVCHLWHHLLILWLQDKSESLLTEPLASKLHIPLVYVTTSPSILISVNSLNTHGFTIVKPYCRP